MEDYLSPTPIDGVVGLVDVEGSATVDIKETKQPALEGSVGLIDNIGQSDVSITEYSSQFTELPAKTTYAPTLGAYIVANYSMPFFVYLFMLPVQDKQFKVLLRRSEFEVSI